MSTFHVVVHIGNSSYLGIKITPPEGNDFTSRTNISEADMNKIKNTPAYKELQARGYLNETNQLISQDHRTELFHEDLEKKVYKDLRHNMGDAVYNLNPVVRDGLIDYIYRVGVSNDRTKEILDALKNHVNRIPTDTTDYLKKAADAMLEEVETNGVKKTNINEAIYFRVKENARMIQYGEVRPTRLPLKSDIKLWIQDGHYDDSFPRA